MPSAIRVCAWIQSATFVTLAGPRYGQAVGLADKSSSVSQNGGFLKRLFHWSIEQKMDYGRRPDWESAMIKYLWIALVFVAVACGTESSNPNPPASPTSDKVVCSSGSAGSAVGCNYDWRCNDGNNYAFNCNSST